MKTCPSLSMDDSKLEVILIILIYMLLMFSKYIYVAVVTVAFPFTPLLLARARICISAAHTRVDLIKGLEVLFITVSYFEMWTQYLISGVLWYMSVLPSS